MSAFRLAFLCAVFTLAVGCGQPQAPAPGGGAPAPGDDGDGPAKPAPKPAAGFDAVKPLVQKNCASCHDGRQQARVDSAGRIKSSANRIESGNMPPGGRISAADKKALLDFAKS